MYAAFITAAFFTGVALNAIIQKADPMEIGKYFFFGFLAVLGLWALEARGMPIVAWGLLVVPTVVFLATLTYVFLSPPPAKPVTPAPVMPPLPPTPTPSPKEEPTLQIPDENTVCVELEFDPLKPKPAPLPSCDVGADGTIGLPGTIPVTPSCPTNLSQSSTSASVITAPSATETLDSLMKSLNMSLTPVTTCK